MNRGTFVRPVCMPHIAASEQVKFDFLDPWTKDNELNEQDYTEYFWITGFGKTNRTTFEKVQERNDGRSDVETGMNDDWKIESDSPECLNLQFF